MKECPWPPPSDAVANRQVAHVVAEVQSVLDTATARAYKRGWDDAQREAEYRASSLSADRISLLQQVSRLEVEIYQLRKTQAETQSEAVPAVLQRVNEKIVSVATREKHRGSMSEVYAKGFDLGIQVATSVVTSLAEEPSDFMSLSRSSRPTS